MPVQPADRSLIEVIDLVAASPTVIYISDEEDEIAGPQTTLARNDNNTTDPLRDDIEVLGVNKAVNVCGDLDNTPQVIACVLGDSQRTNVMPTHLKARARGSPIGSEPLPDNLMRSSSPMWDCSTEDRNQLDFDPEPGAGSITPTLEKGSQRSNKRRKFAMTMSSPGALMLDLPGPVSPPRVTTALPAPRMGPLTPIAPLALPELPSSPSSTPSSVVPSLLEQARNSHISSSLERRKLVDGEQVRSNPVVVKKLQVRTATVKSLICKISGEESDALGALCAKLTEMGCTWVTARDTNLASFGLDMVLRLERRITDTFDTELKAFIEIPEKIIEEETKICVLNAYSLSNLLLAETSEQERFFKCIRKFYGENLFFVVGGLRKCIEKYMKKKGDQITARARKSLKNGKHSSPSGSGNEINKPPALLKGPIDFARGQAQLELRCNARIIYADKDSQAIDWIADLLQDISFKRYSTLVRSLGKRRKMVEGAANSGGLILRNARIRLSQDAARMLESDLGNMAQLASYLQHNGPEAANVVRGVTSETSRVMHNLLFSTDPNKILT